MAVRYPGRATRWSTKAVIAAALLAVLLVAAVPVALFVGLILMLLGHVVGGLALFGASILTATAVVVAEMTERGASPGAGGTSSGAFGGQVADSGPAAPPPASTSAPWLTVSPWVCT
jgi:hypothetical protein